MALEPFSSGGDVSGTSGVGGHGAGTGPAKSSVGGLNPALGRSSRDLASDSAYCAPRARTSRTVNFFTGRSNPSKSPFGVNPPPSMSTKIGLLYAHGCIFACGLLP